ncbi:efflux RND transporter permease subunit [Salinarchaeum laminariae]|uniref:efflux RND transporter permease subunit n=1 Tax=Salinarchaeum laminariae TaxID=869888 RepID=UPI004046F746
MSAIDRFVDIITNRSKTVILVILLLTAVMGGGVMQVSQESSLNQFGFGSNAEEAQDYVNENFKATDANSTSAQVIFRGSEDRDALSQEALIQEIELQQAFLEDETVNSTLGENPLSGLSNAVAKTVITQNQGRAAAQSATLEEQRATLAEMDGATYNETIATLLSKSSGENALFAFVPNGYDPGSTTAEARMMLVSQEVPPGESTGQGAAPEAIVDAQVAMNDIVDERYGGEAFTFGAGVVSDELSGSMNDSLMIVMPLALLFVVVVLTIAYRDLFDILLGVVGIALVLIWTFGFMGWSGITFSQLMITVPVLLIGLSIDYAIHVLMRHREQREEDDNGGARETMRPALLGVGGALVWVTITAVIGFLSNLTSPLPPLQHFGIVSAFGIAATLLIYGTFVPAVKIELDEFLEGRGWDRKKRAFGTGGGAFSTFLTGGKTFAKRAPWAVVAIALLLTLGGVYGATQIDTSFQTEDFIAEDPPGYLDNLPEPFAPGDYQIKSQLDYVGQHFGQDQSSTILIRGNVSSPEAFEEMAAAEQKAAESDAFNTFANGQVELRSPLRGMQTFAAENPDSSFNATFSAADTDGDNVPDQNIKSVYDAYFEATPAQASSTIYRTDDGNYEAAQMIVTKAGPATRSATTSASYDLADSFGETGATATATGDIVVFSVIEEELLDTVIQTLIVTIVAVIAFLMVAYWYVHDSAILGAVTLTPIVLSVAWILGTMWLMDIGFNIITGTITSLTIGLGVAYNIHVTERYMLELGRDKDVWDAIGDAVTGTGGALLGSAGTTVGGFGVLAFAIVPPIQQFGIITGITIIYAFLGSVFLLPSFLVIWTKYLGPSEAFEEDAAAPATGEVTAADE